MSSPERFYTVEHMGCKVRAKVDTTDPEQVVFVALLPHDDNRAEMHWFTADELVDLASRLHSLQIHLVTERENA